MLELAITYWPHILGGAGAVAGLAAFVSQLLQIQKLKYELDRLKKQEEKDKKLLQLATPEEVEKFGRPTALLQSSRRQVVILSLLLVLIGPTLLLTHVSPDSQRSSPQAPTSAATQPFAEAWLVLLDSGNVSAAWHLLAPELRAQMTEQQFGESLRKSRPTIDTASRRSLVGEIASVDQQTGLPLKVLQFFTKVQDGSNAIEQVTLSWSGGALAVSGYNVTQKP